MIFSQLVLSGIEWDMLKYFLWMWLFWRCGNRYITEFGLWDLLSNLTVSFLQNVSFSPYGIFGWNEDGYVVFFWLFLKCYFFPYPLLNSVFLYQKDVSYKLHLAVLISVHLVLSKMSMRCFVHNKIFLIFGYPYMVLFLMSMETFGP